MKSQWITALLVVSISFILVCCSDKKTPALQGRNYTGLLFGQPYYLDVVGDSANYTAQIDSIIKAYESCFSINDPKSVISRFNAFQRTDSMFVFNDSTRAFGIVYDLLRDYHRQCMQYYDPTTNPLKRAWMVANMNELGEPNLDSLFEFVGFDNAKMDLSEITEGDYLYKESHLRKADSRLEADFTALAAAVAMDNIVDFLKTKKVVQVKLRQGRDLITYGTAIDTMNVVPMGLGSDSADQLVRVVNRAFTFTTGQDKAKMIDVTYGYPINNEMVYVGVSAPTLSQSVVFAEAFMIMGLQKAGEYYTANESTDVQSFIFYQEGNEMHNASTEDFDAMIVQPDTIQE